MNGRSVDDHSTMCVCIQVHVHTLYNIICICTAVVHTVGLQTVFVGRLTGGGNVEAYYTVLHIMIRGIMCIIVLSVCT